MFELKHPLMAPDEETAVGGPPPEAPPVDSMPDDHIDEGWQDDAPEPETKDEPKSSEDAVSEALQKLAGEEPDEPEDPAPEPAPESSPEEQERARIEALYTIPRGLKGDQRAAYKALSDHARSLDETVAAKQQEYEQVAERINTFEEIIKDSGATPEVLNDHFMYIKHVTSGNLEAALAFIEGERKALAEAMGKPLEGVDLLADYPDLRQRVDNLSMDEESALEIAAARRAQARTQRQQEQSRTEEQQRTHAAQLAQERQQALGAIEAWTAAQAGTMLPTDWQVMEEAIVTYLQSPVTQQVLSKIPPAQWLDHIQSHYDSLKRLSAARAPSPGSTPTPLRPRGAGGKLMREPTNAEDAVEARLAAMRQ